tara:strand:- start:295 stop:1296 length:1002 start_codon:yes stop_codon:yes gene_type:complete
MGPFFIPLGKRIMINGIKSFWESDSSKWLKIFSLVFVAASVTVAITNTLIQGNEEFKKSSITFVLFTAGVLLLSAFLSLISFFAKRSEKKKKPLLAKVALTVLAVGGILVGGVLLLLTLGVVESTNNFVTTLGVALPVFVTIGYGAIWITYNIQRESEQLEENRKTHRKNHTLNILLQSRLSETYQNRMKDAAKFYPSHNSFPNVLEMENGEKRTMYEMLVSYSGMFQEGSTFIDPKNKKISFEVSKELHDHARAIEGLNYLLNYFEFISIGIKNGDLDETVLEDSLHWILINLLDRTKNFITLTHTQSNSNKIWENAIKLGEKWQQNAAIKE